MRNTPFLFVPFLCVGATAQYVTLEPLPARGMMPAFQAGMTFDHAPNRIVRKEPRLPVQLNTFAPGGLESPNYDIDEIAAWIAVRFNADVQLDVDAMSTGNDVLPVVFDTVAGFYRIQNGNSNGWATLYLSRIDDAEPNGNADIFGFYFDNPPFPSGLTKSIYHEVVHADYVGPSALPVGAAIVALDVNMGLIHSNQGFLQAPVLPETRRLYFSLSDVSALNLATAMNLPNAGSFDGAAIFVAAYDGPTGQLVDVRPHRTRAQLDLPLGANVDALGVAKVSEPAPATVGTHQELVRDTFLYIVSLEDDPNDEELFVIAELDPQQPGVPTWAPLRTDDGWRLVGPNGRLAGRVKGLCAQDPDTPDGAHSFGVPGGDSFVVPVPGPNPSPVTLSTMNLSVTAISSAPGPNDAFELHGVLSGGTYTGETMVGLWFRCTTWQLSFFELLPNRPAGGEPYSFMTRFSVPWHGSSGTLKGMNEYDVVLTTTPLSPVPGFEVSTRARFRRGEL